MFVFAVFAIGLGLSSMTSSPEAGVGQVTFTTPTPTVAPEVIAQALAPMTDAIANERRRQAELPPAQTGADRLIRMGRLDQVARVAMQSVDLSTLPPGDANVVRARALGVMHEIDLENQAQFRLIPKPDRWFTQTEYGAEASQAAFLIVQHSNEELWRIYLPLLEPLVGTGEINDAQYALMYDRLAVSEGRLQRYGSQFACNGRDSRLADLEDPENVDARRAAMGMTSMAENARRFERSNPCQMNSRR